MDDPSLFHRTKIDLRELPPILETFSTEVIATEDLTGQELTVYTQLMGINNKVLVLKSEKIPGLNNGQKYTSRVDYPNFATVVTKRVIVLDKFPEDSGTVYGEYLQSYE